MDTGIYKFFSQLKPVCDKVVTNPSKENLIDLREIIKIIPQNLLQKLQEYIIFPLYLHLGNEQSSNIIKQELIDTLRCLLEKVRSTRTKIFFQLCMVISNQIFDVRTTNLIPTADEELKLSTITCLQILFNNISNDILCEIYSESYNVHFSTIIYLCIKIAKNEKMRNLRLNAINCIMTISYIHDEADFTDKVLRKQIADTVMSFLPGIVIGLRDVALGDEKQGQKITALAVKALNRIIILHMADLECPEDGEVVFEFPCIENKKEEEISSELRSAEWYSKTAQNLHKIIESLVPLQSHYHENVRYELSDFCSQIIKNCSQNLQNSLSICIEVLIVLSEDDNEKVSKRSIAAMKSKIIDMNLTFAEILAENFYNVITRLPGTINGTDEQKQLSALNLLIGYLRILEPNILFAILQSPNQLSRLVECLIFISTFEKSNVTIFEEIALRNFESISETSVTWKQFKYISDKNIFKKFQTALHLLSKSEALELIIDYLNELFLNKTANKNEIIFLLNEILSVKNLKNYERIINNILKMYLEEEHWYLSTNTASLTLSEVHNNIIQMCLLVEGIGNFSNALGIRFKSYLLKVLYVTLERAGSAQPLLSSAGLLTLLKISQNCKYNSVTELIVQNTDYFSFHVVKRLKKLESNITVLDVLNVVMKYSTIELLPPIMEVVNEVLINSRDKYQDHNILSFLRVFESFVRNLKRWLNINIENKNRILNLLVEYQNSMEVLYAMHEKNLNLSDDIMEKSAKEMYEEDMAKTKEELEEECNEIEHKTPEPPESIKLTVEILKRSLNFLPSKNRERKLLTLNILKDGLEIIKDWENELLPIVHLIWSPLVNRFKEFDDPLIINRSFELLTVLADLSKDFIRVRTSKDVLLEICKSLKNLSTKSYLKDRGSAYRYNQEYKLQLNILNNIGQLVSNLQMTESDVELILNASSSYLSCRQPIPLQEAVLTCFLSIARYNFDSVWLHLLEIYSKCKEETNEFSKNTELVLKQLEVVHW